MFFSKKKAAKKPAPKHKKAKTVPKKAAKKAKKVPAKKAAKKPEQQPAKKALTPGEVKEKLKEGWTRCILTFELAGSPREHVEETLRAYILNIKTDGRVLCLREEFADALEHDDGVFSAFVEMEALVEDLETMTWLAVNFMPASIEVHEPEKLSVQARVITNWYNDLLSKLHELSTILREERAVNQHLTEAMNALIKNAILAGVRPGPKTAKELQAITGITAEQLEPFLKHLVEKKRLAHKGSAYALP